MELPGDFFVKPIDGHDDLVAFQFDFELGEGKALSESIVEELENGDLIIEGYAAVFEGLDREGENFAPGAFKRGCKAFLKHSAPLCFHHRKADVLGKVLDLQEEEGKGLKMRARIDGAIKRHPTLGVIYEQIKRGTFNGLSIGGIFRRALMEGGPRIVDMDFTEISVTPAPVHTGPRFDVVAGKALTDVDFKIETGDESNEDVRVAVEEAESQMRAILSGLQGLNSALTRLTDARLSKDDKPEEPSEPNKDDAPAPDGAEAVTV
jgi:HK97 family phage prohead protease